MSDPNKNKSLSAESELYSAYDLFYKGEYNQCFKNIKKKLQKLKNPIDIAYFNFLKLRLLQKLKKPKEQNQLMNEIKNEFLTNSILYNDENLPKKFKDILRTFDDEKGAQQIFEIQLKNKNLTKLTPKEQNDILKELTLNFEFSDIYRKSNLFITNPNGANIKFLKLIKFETVFYLYKSKKLSENMTKKIYEDLIKNFDDLHSENGYYDIIAQYCFEFNEPDKLMQILEKKEQSELTHVPINDIKLDGFLKEGKINDIILYLYNNIKDNSEKCNFTNYERCINLIFNYCQKNNLKVDFSKILPFKDNVVEKPNEINNINELINELLNLFEHIKLSKNKIINSFKSGILGQLMVIHNSIKLNKEYNNETKIILFDLIQSLLERAINKQAILLELGKYFIYLDDSDREKLLKKYGEITLDSIEKITKENFDNFLFYVKLEKMLSDPKKNNEKIKELIPKFIKAYLQVIKTIEKDRKLEKGERLLSDDLIVLANEYYYEYFEETKIIDNNISSMLLFINLFSHEKSPYNYDISIYLAKTYGHLNLYPDALDIMKYMNLKGPQYETVSYFIFNYFEKGTYKNGLNYLIDNSERWQNENRINAKKTLWKMFSGGNYWNSQELIDFLNDNKTSYYHILLQFYDILLGLNDNYFNKDGKNEEEEKDHLHVLDILFESFKGKLSENKLIKNQDMFIMIHKYNSNNWKYFNNDFSLLEKNPNYKRQHYRNEIDCLGKENNCLYKLYPGYKNNFIENCEISPFDKYDNYSFLLMRMISIIVTSRLLKLKENDNDEIKKIKEDTKIYFDYSKENNSELDICLCNIISYLFEVYENSEKIIDTEKIIKLFEIISKIISNLKEKRNKIKYYDFSSISDYIKEYNEFKNFYIIEYTNVTSKFIDFISDHKKEIKEPQVIKAKLNEIFKSPIINELRETEKFLDDMISKCHKEDNLGWNYEEELNKENILNIDDEDIKKHLMNSAKDIQFKIDEKHKEIFKEIKENCKRVIDYIKQLI